MRRMLFGRVSTPIGATNMEMIEWVGSTRGADSQADPFRVILIAFVVAMALIP